MNKKIYSIQFLRAVACLLVLFVHIGIKSEQYAIAGFDWIFKIGGAGVDLFFIISGYIMCFITENKKIRATDFFLARIIRIIPLYWVLTSIALIVYIIKPSMVNSSGGITDVFASYALIPTGNKYLVANGWTLSYEFWFYIIFSLSIFISKNKYLFIVIALIISLVIIGFFIDRNVITTFATNELMLEFLLGILGYFLQKSFSKTITPQTSLLAVALGLGMLFYEFFVHKFSPLRSVNYGIPIFFIFLGSVMLERFFTIDFFLLRYIERIGDFSYSLYLVHPFVLSVLSFILCRLFSIKSLFNFVTIMFLVTLLSGYFLYCFVEQPLNNFLKSILMRKANIVIRTKA